MDGWVESSETSGPGGQLRRRHRIWRIRPDHLLEPEAVVAFDIEDRLRPRAVIEYSASAAQDGLAIFRGCEGKRNTRRKLVVIVKEILPVVPDACCNRQIRAQAEIVLNKTSHNGFEKHYLAVALLRNQRKGAILQV